VISLRGAEASGKTLKCVAGLGSPKLGASGARIGRLSPLWRQSKPLDPRCPDQGATGSQSRYYLHIPLFFQYLDAHAIEFAFEEQINRGLAYP
jgi:hypothetical protein